jgi:hypothetical protein
MRRSRIALIAALVVVLSGFAGFQLLRTRTPSASPRTGPHSGSGVHPKPTTTLPTGPKPIIGVLGVSGKYLAREKASGVGAVTIGVAWSSAEPSTGVISSPYLAGIQRQISAARAVGLSVVLDPGLQYPPSWVFALPGGTRFVNQYGDVFTGSPDSGNDVANAVTDPAVRAAESAYLRLLGAQITRGTIFAVRQGGGPLGELRYPSPDFNGHANSFWAYDVNTQSASSVPGWKPGTGTGVQAKMFLDSYNANLDDYGRWLNGQLHRDFDTTELVLLPGWGERIGTAPFEVASLLTLDLPEYNQGLDWSDLLYSLPDAAHSVAYTTYVDAPSNGSSLRTEDPADYLAYLIQGTQLKLGGENTGGGTTAALDLSLHRARTLHFAILNWMDESQLVASTRGLDPSGPTFNLLKVATSS